MAPYGQAGYGQGNYGNNGGAIYSLPVSYYLALYTSQYRLASNLLAWTALLLQPLVDVTTAMAMMTDAFDLDLAVGNQLDTLGVIIGISRLATFQPRNGVSPIMDDATYRIILKARTAFNQWDGKINSLQQIWKSLFPYGRIYIQDNQNMSATIILSGTFTSILQDLISHDYAVPRPETVQYQYVFAVLPIFGFDRNDAFIAGFDAGHWA